MSLVDHVVLHFEPHHFNNNVVQYIILSAVRKRNLLFFLILLNTLFLSGDPIHAASISAAAAGPSQDKQRGTQDNLQRQTNLSTILMICFIAEHNLPFLIADRMTDLQKSMFPHSAIAQAMHTHKKK